ncbi:MoaA/NifB/PqqE/SkfB family radical SAM enzyme [Nocardia transvalensis]|uniref:MoaA/NifB/PqqE/SkfB family radical SAM enzyme n=1 Tax=Nocardia transvalensis TaxID=37333 RepID=A0A7W9PJV5_9NOCA|nr:radical SAM protein [Nocardia transvalensis]MBB5916823.1 MoaA/NifB/PqqE/SkfB family radical SAM enzyme [Nocardia transvalensis]
MNEPEPVGRLLRLVVDAVNECNLRCLYCHPGEVWKTQQLPVAAIVSAFEAAEQAGVLEVVLTGGEITLHESLPAVLDATHQLAQCAATLITNATKITDDLAQQLAASNLSRICTSVDGITNDLHGSARGKNLPKVLDGLARLHETGKPVTVITVVHQSNWRQVIDLSDHLAETGLAVQHHLCAPSFSGQARAHYPRLALAESDFLGVQDLVDRHHARLAAAGLYLTFNSCWPATGRRTLRVNPSRTITLQQLSEQVKDTLANIRPDGEFRLQAATWGREMIGNAALGSVHTQGVTPLLVDAEILLARGTARQLPRAVEAQHKFQLGPRADSHTTDTLIGRAEGTAGEVELIPITSVDEHWLMNNPADLDAVATGLRTAPDTHRVVRHPTGTVLAFDRARSQITLLTGAEWQAVQHLSTIDASAEVSL